MLIGRPAIDGRAARLGRSRPSVPGDRALDDARPPQLAFGAPRSGRRLDRMLQALNLPRQVRPGQLRGPYRLIRAGDSDLQAPQPSSANLEVTPCRKCRGKAATMAEGPAAAAIPTVVAAALAPGTGPAAAPGAAGEDSSIEGSVNCRARHESLDHSRPSALPRGFVKLDEWKTWKEDRQALAGLSNLKGPRGLQMASLLKIADPTAKAGCIGCHGAGEAAIRERQEGTSFGPTRG